MTIRAFMEEHFRHFNAAAALDAAKGYEAHLAEGGSMLVAVRGSGAGLFGTAPPEASAEDLGVTLRLEPLQLPDRLAAPLDTTQKLGLAVTLQNHVDAASSTDRGSRGPRIGRSTAVPPRPAATPALNSTRIDSLGRRARDVGGTGIFSFD